MFLSLAGPVYIVDTAFLLSKYASIYLSRCNNLFCFSAIGAERRERFVDETAPRFMVGHIYHRVLPCNLKGSLRWYVHDPDGRTTEAMSLSLYQQYANVDNVQDTLSRINAYAMNLITLGQPSN